MDTRPIDELNENPKNPRTMSDHSGNALATSMKEFGDMSGIVFNVRTKHLVGGHQRIKVLNRLLKGKKEVVITNNFAEPDHVGTVALGYVAYDNRQFAYREVDWDEGRELAANVAANRISGEFNIDMLAQVNYELSQLENGSGLLELTGQTNDEINRLLDMVGAGGERDPLEDAPPPVDDAQPAVSQLGEIYQLGNHRLMCGDATDFGQVSDLMDGKEAEMIFTDPPYNFENEGAGFLRKSTANMRERVEDIVDFDPHSIAYILELPINTFMFFCNKTLIPIYLDIFKALDFNLLVWHKTNPTPFTSNNFLPDIEYLLLFTRKGRVWNNSLQPTSIYSKVFSSSKLEGRNDTEDSHPTIKPLNLLMDKIRVCSNRGGGVLDLFGGSGSTLIACDKLDRICYMMELDPHYCDVIRKRYAQQMGLEDWKTATPAINAPEAPVEPVASLPGDRLDETPKE